MIKRPLIFIILIIALLISQVAVCHYFPDKVEAKKFMRFDIQHKEKNEGNTIIVFYDIQTTKKYLVFESGLGGVGMVELK